MPSPGVVPDASVSAGPLGIADLGRLTLLGAVPDAVRGGAASLPHPLDARRGCQCPSVPWGGAGSPG